MIKIHVQDDIKPFEPSQKLQKLISDINKEVDDEIIIEFRQDFNLLPNSAFYREEDGIVKIGITTGLLSNIIDCEQSIAHELGHVLLSKVYKYPSLNIDEGVSQKIKVEINWIRNSIEDNIINLLITDYDISSFGSNYYPNLEYEIYELSIETDPCEIYEIESDQVDSFILSRILLALGYYDFIEVNEEKREKLRTYLNTVSDKFPDLFLLAKKALFIDQSKSIITKSGFKESLEIAFTHKNLIQYVTIDENMA